MKRKLTARETADLIERFLNRQQTYPQEWNDFVETHSVEPQLEPLRERCYELDPLVNSHLPPDKDALAELKEIVEKLRAS
jgi:hypothetical protein